VWNRLRALGRSLKSQIDSKGIVTGIITAGLLGLGGLLFAWSPWSASNGPKSPDLAKLLPADVRVLTSRTVNLDGSSTPQHAVAAIGPWSVDPSQAVLTVVLIAWDGQAHRWTLVYD